MHYTHNYNNSPGPNGIAERVGCGPCTYAFCCIPPSQMKAAKVEILTRKQSLYSIQLCSVKHCFLANAENAASPIAVYICTAVCGVSASCQLWQYVVAFSRSVWWLMGSQWLCARGEVSPVQIVACTRCISTLCLSLYIHALRCVKGLGCACVPYSVHALRCVKGLGCACVPYSVHALRCVKGLGCACVPYSVHGDGGTPVVTT